MARVSTAISADIEAAAAPARVSASSLKWLPTCPRTHWNRTRPGRTVIATSIDWISARFFTGLPLAVFQPLRRQPWIHSEAHLIAYCESDSISSSSAPGCAAIASSTARSSAIWLVPDTSPPEPLGPSWFTPAPPMAPPGLRRQEPSVLTMITTPDPTSAASHSASDTARTLGTHGAPRGRSVHVGELLGGTAPCTGPHREPGPPSAGVLRRPTGSRRRPDRHHPQPPGTQPLPAAADRSRRVRSLARRSRRAVRRPHFHRDDAASSDRRTRRRRDDRRDLGCGHRRTHP